MLLPQIHHLKLYALSVFGLVHLLLMHSSTIRDTSAL